MADRSDATPSRPSKRASTSSKKVAAAARAGRTRRGGSMRERPKLAYPLAIVAILVLGTALVVFSKTERVAVAENAEPPKLGDHWHAAYGIYLCDHYLEPIADNGNDPDGIHTHGDGLMHVHPFGSGAAGFNARVGVWADAVGLTLTSDSLTLPDGTSYSNGLFECDGEPADVYLIRWADAFDPTSPGEVFTSGFRDVRYVNDFSAFAFAVVPPDQVGDVPMPDSVAALYNIEDLPAEEQVGAQGATDLSLPSEPSTDGATDSTVSTDVESTETTAGG